MKLYLSKHKNQKYHSTVSKMLKEFGYSVVAPDARDVFNYLKHESCLIESGKTWNEAILYYVDETKLKEILHSQEIFKLAEKCVYYEIP